MRTHREKFYRWLHHYALDKYIGLKQARNAPKEVFITDHAILRYLERVEGVDVGAIRQKLLTETDGLNIVKVGNTLKTMWRVPERKVKHTLSMSNKQKLEQLKGLVK